MSEEFRDKISTVDEKGKRVWIFPKKPSGKFYDRRKIVSYLLLALLFSGPFIKIDGEPLLMINIIERKFSIFGQIFWPQDLYIFALGMIVFVVFIILFTVIFGRLFCGWICPQTIFMEMVFRRIEYWIEGDRNYQKKLSQMPWNAEKIRKRGLKNVIFFIISFLIANIFLSYIIGYEAVLAIALDSPANHVGGLVALLLFTFAFFMVFLKLREQVCTTICPYGRLQGVLLDRNSLNIMYDYVRGEKRGKFDKRKDRKTEGKGDCIDCNQCVVVCPTGIDIRDGVQLECVNCTACIDACDAMMDKVGLEKGLIRYASEAGIAEKKKFKFNTRVTAYSILLILLMGVLVSLIAIREDFQTTILRTRGTLFEKHENGRVSNIYDVTVVNKTNDTIPVDFRLLNLEGELQLIGDPIILYPRSNAKSKFMIYLKRMDLTGMNTELEIGVFSGDEMVDDIETTFIGPKL